VRLVGCVEVIGRQAEGNSPAPGPACPLTGSTAIQLSPPITRSYVYRGVTNGHERALGRQEHGRKRGPLAYWRWVPRASYWLGTQTPRLAHGMVAMWKLGGG
jgi:hypothetical protein